MALLDCARRVHQTVTTLLDEREATCVAATSRRAYERIRHRSRLIAVQVEAHGCDRADRAVLRDETMADNVR